MREFKSPWGHQLLAPINQLGSLKQLDRDIGGRAGNPALIYSQNVAHIDRPVKSACSSLAEHLLDVQVVEGSIPSSRTVARLAQW